MKKISFTFLVAVIALSITVSNGCLSSDKTETLKYPETRTVEQVDDYHGQTVADPYRWLEDDVRESVEVEAWVAEQNLLARAYLESIPQRSAIANRLTELWNYERYSAPSKMSGRYLYWKNDGLQDQAVLYVADAYDAEGRVLIDPNEWSEDGTVSISAYEVSEDGKLMAYAQSEAGSDWKNIHVMEIDSGEVLSDELKWIKWTGISWDKAGTGFYYNRYPEPPEGQAFQVVARDQMVYFHTLGTDQSEDRLIFSRPDEPDWGFGVVLTDDGEYLVVMMYRGTDPQNQVFVRSTASDDEPWQELIGDFENEFSFLGERDSAFYFLTDLDAPTKRIVAMDLQSPGREQLIEIVPQRDATLHDANLVGGRFFVQYLEDILPRIEMFGLDGSSLGEVELPGVGAVSGFAGEPDDTETFYTFRSYNTPTTSYRYDLLTGESQLLRRPTLDFDPEQFAVNQVFYESKDGTRVPMTLAYRKDAAGHRPGPVLLYGYGGFSISILPYFSPEYVVWMELGGTLAVANLRGGGEYGEAWHVAGKIENKQNVFDDFIAAAEWLIDKGYTTSEQLAIMGGSNGGLLVGAVETQRPELFGASIPRVGVMDMLRFHQFTAGQFWRDEYGSADDPEQFETLLSYSPYHNVRPGTEYPATMIMSADTDDRVVPMHSFKFAAAMQQAQSGDAPILLRIETRAGHGRGTPISKRIDSAADRWAFLVKVLGMQPNGFE